MMAYGQLITVRYMSKSTSSSSLEVMCGIFYPNIKFDSKKLAPKLLEDINIFLEEFYKDLDPDKTLSQIIFLLFLRTNFHVWNMKSLFDTSEQPKSFIIISNTNLFGSGCVIPCLIIGIPGTSKTLAIQLFTDYKQGKQENHEDKKEPRFFSSIYLSTRVSEAEGLNAHYRD